jgi:hypothetical protein
MHLFTHKQNEVCSNFVYDWLQLMVFAQFGEVKQTENEAWELAFVLLMC